LTYDPKRRSRRSLRLPGYDYTESGAYFIIVVAHGRECLFGQMVNEAMLRTDAGHVVQAVWDRLPAHYPHVRLDAFVIMPNHVHGVLILGSDSVGAGLKPAPTERRYGLPEIVRGFKTFSARRINECRNAPGAAVWQRNYYEHVIRNEESLLRIREYIENNPLQWELDRENPARPRSPRISTEDEIWRV